MISITLFYSCNNKDDFIQDVYVNELKIIAKLDSSLESILEILWKLNSGFDDFVFRYKYKNLFNNPENIKFVQDALFGATNEPGGTSFGSRLTKKDFIFAGKTGTSEKGRDLWFIGSIPQLTTGVWLGYDNNKETRRSLAFNIVPIPGF